MLLTKHGLEAAPAVSTVGEVIKRHGLVAERRRRGAAFKVERGTLTAPQRSNHVLRVDFKGWFVAGDGRRYDHLTVTDFHSRFILKIDALEEARTYLANSAFKALFRRQGLGMQTYRAKCQLSSARQNPHQPWGPAPQPSRVLRMEPMARRRVDRAANPGRRTILKREPLWRNPPLRLLSSRAVS